MQILGSSAVLGRCTARSTASGITPTTQSTWPPSRRCQSAYGEYEGI